MAAMKGPAVFLAQFLRDEAPFDNLENIGTWAADLGYKGVQIPTWDKSVFDLDKAAKSKTYCDEIKGTLKDRGLEISELATHLQGQVMAIHPAYEVAFAPFYPKGLKDKARVAWAAAELKKSIKASVNLGLKAIPSFTGALAWHMIYPWPQRPAGLIDTAFKELFRRWKPVLDMARDKGCNFAYELHPGSDVYDGATFEMFLKEAKNHKAICINYDPSHFLLQQLDYLEFIKLYGKRITAFHVKDAEFNASGRVGVYGGYQGWSDRAGRFRSLGDGQVDFVSVFSLLAEAGYKSWATLEWECCVKSPDQGAAEGAPFIEAHIVQTTSVAFDDFAGGKADLKTNKKILGIS